MPTLEMGEDEKVWLSDIVSCSVDVVGMGELDDDWDHSNNWWLVFPFFNFADDWMLDTVGVVVVLSEDLDPSRDWVLAFLSFDFRANCVVGKTP